MTRQRDDNDDDHDDATTSNDEHDENDVKMLDITTSDPAFYSYGFIIVVATNLSELTCFTTFHKCNFTMPTYFFPA